MASKLNEKELAKQALLTKAKLGSSERKFIIQSKDAYVYKKIYHEIDYDTKCLLFAVDNVGTNTDAFILYAVSMLKICDKEAIINFLSILKKRNKDFAIPWLDTADAADFIKRRLKALTDKGFLFKHAFVVPYYDSKKSIESENTVYLYSITKSSQSFMNQKLVKSVPWCDWVQVKPLIELIGIAAASYVGCKLANNPTFVEYKKAVFKGKTTGTNFIPNEVKYLKDDEEIYVGCVPGFIYRDETIQSEEDATDVAVKKVTTALEYINYRAYSGKTARIVYVAESYEDLEKLANLIIKTEVLLPYLDSVYFTGEGLVRHSKELGTAFLKLASKENISFVPARPDFI